MGIIKSCDHPQRAVTSHYFTATNHNHPGRPIIIKSTQPNNNNSLVTTLLTIINYELYFCHHYSTSIISTAV